MRSTILDGSHDFFTYQKYRLYRNNGSLRGHHLEVTGQTIDFSRFYLMNLYSFLRGFSQCQRRIHSSTQMMSYIDSSKYRFFDFFLD